MKKYNNKYQVTINTIIFIFLVLSPIIDNITGIFLMAGRSTNLSSILKATVLFLCLIQIVVNGHSNVKELIYVIVGILLISFNLLVSFLYYKNGFGYNVNTTIRLLNLFVLYQFFKRQKKTMLHNLLNFYSWFYPLSLFIPTLLGIGYNTYKVEGIGYKGFYYAGNEISVIMIILIAYSLNRLSKNKCFVNILNCFFTIISSLLIGTKSVIIATIIITLIYFFERLPKVQFTKILGGMVVFTLIILATVYLFNDFTNSLIGIWKQRFEKLDNQWYSFLLSNRNTKLREVFRLMKSEGSILILFGGGAYFFAVQNNISVEMDFFDLLSWYGIFIAIYFSVLIINYIFSIKKKFSTIQFTLICSLAMISFWAGHILFAPSVSMVLALYIADAKKDWSDILKI